MGVSWRQASLKYAPVSCAEWLEEGVEKITDAAYGKRTQPGSPFELLIDLARNASGGKHTVCSLRSHQYRYSWASLLYALQNHPASSRTPLAAGVFHPQREGRCHNRQNQPLGNSTTDFVPARRTMSASMDGGILRRESCLHAAVATTWCCCWCTACCSAAVIIAIKAGGMPRSTIPSS